jgi:hypothetical protein
MVSSDIDWTKIKDMEDVQNIPEHLLFDESQALLPSDMLQLNPHLTEEEIEDAFFWKDYNRGKILITGEPGSGKGITSHMIAYKMKHYFGKTAIIDTRPRKIFGAYVPFSADFLEEQIDRMSAVEKGCGRVLQDGRWLAFHERDDEDKENNRDRIRGEVLMRNSVVLLDEYGNKYMPRLQPNLRISQDLLKLDNFWRHLHMLTLGVGVSLDDFNRKAIDKSVWEAKCNRMSARWKDKNEIKEDDIVIGVYLQAVKWNPATDTLTSAGDTVKLIINASEPRHCLGGKSWKDIYNTDNAQGFESSISRRKQ